MIFQMTNEQREKAEEFLLDIIDVIKMRIEYHIHLIDEADDVEHLGALELIRDEAIGNLNIASNIYNEIKIAKPNAYDIRNENQLDLINEMNK